MLTRYFYSSVQTTNYREIIEHDVLRRRRRLVQRPNREESTCTLPGGNTNKQYNEHIHLFETTQYNTNIDTPFVTTQSEARDYVRTMSGQNRIDASKNSQEEDNDWDNLQLEDEEFHISRNIDTQSPLRTRKQNQSCVNQFITDWPHNNAWIGRWPFANTYRHHTLAFSRVCQKNSVRLWFD